MSEPMINTYYLPDTNIETQLQQLVESVLQNDELNRFASRCEQLISDKNLCLYSSSLVIRSYIGDNVTALSVDFDLPEDLAIWKLCLLTGIDNLNAPLQSSLQSSPRNVVVTTNSSDMATVLDFICPILQITDFKYQELNSAIALLPRTGHDAEELRLLFDSVLEHQRNEKRLLLSRCDDIINNLGQRIQIQSFQIFSDSSARNILSLSVGCTSPSDLSLWTSSVIAALMKLEINENFKMKRSGIYFEVTIEAKYMERVLDYLKPLAHRVTSQHLEFTDVPSDIMHMCSDNFDSSSLQCIMLTPEESALADFTSWLDFVRKVKPRIVKYDLLGLKDEIPKFLLPLADLVERIEIWEYTTHGRMIDPMPLTVIREMLSRKCKHLHINGEISSISLAEVENLIQFFHHNEKNISLRIPTDIDEINVQAGEFSLNTFMSMWQWKDSISITNMEFEL